MATTKISELEEKLILMQKELEALKDKEAKEATNSTTYDKFKEKMEVAQNEVMAVLKEVVETEKVVAAGACISHIKIKGESTNVGWFSLSSFDAIDEDSIATALDVFTNPRRITLIKLLIHKELSASEITKETGLAGGQLYHHLSCLESARLILKDGDKYRTRGEAQSLLIGLHAAVGGMSIAKKK